MKYNVLWGLGLILAAGTLQGAFALPMKFARKWNYENIWLVFAATGLVLFPWLFYFSTIPHTWEVFRLASSRSVAGIILFGVCWGVGATLTGLGLYKLGLALGFSIILGLSASFGSLVPLLVHSPGDLLSPRGITYLLGTGLMLLGIGSGAVAGSLREKSLGQGAEEPRNAAARGSFLAGFLICAMSGIFSSTLNFSFAFGTEVIEKARNLGASPVWAANAVWAPATTGGFLANLLYCAYLFARNKSFSRFLLPGTRIYWLFGLGMGLSWFSGLSLYGMGVYRLGDFGVIIGWPLFMGTIILTSNTLGLATGEWTHSHPKAKRYLFLGILIILAALIVLSLAQRLAR